MDESPGDSITLLRVAVARMEGMLTQALSDQGTRLTKAEAEITAVHGRLSEKGKLLASHTERIESNHDRIIELERRQELCAPKHRLEELERKQENAVPRTVAVFSPIIAGVALIVGIAQLIPWTR